MAHNQQNRYNNYLVSVPISRSLKYNPNLAKVEDIPVPGTQGEAFRH